MMRKILLMKNILIKVKIAHVDIAPQYNEEQQISLEKEIKLIFNMLNGEEIPFPAKWNENGNLIDDVETINIWTTSEL